MSNIAIICAMPEEADALYASQGGNRAFGHINARCLEANGHAITIAACGLGKVNAAISASLLAQLMPADMLLMSGTCGKIGAAEGSAFWLTQAVQHDYGLEVPGGFVHYSAGAMPHGEASLTHYTAMADHGLGLPHARIASGDRFIACPERARFLADDLQTSLVDMEVAAIAQVATQMGLPWAAIKAVSDDADDATGGDFRDNLIRASRQAAAGIEKWIALL